MATYTIKTSSGTQAIPATYQNQPLDSTNLYQAIHYLTSNASFPNGTDLMDGSTFVFGKNKDASTVNNYSFVYRYDKLIKTASGSIMHTNTEALTYIKNNQYTKAIKSNGVHINSNTKISFMYDNRPYSWVTEDDVYAMQEKTVGGYYTARTVSESFDEAEFTVDLSAPSTNFGSYSNPSPSAYIAMGINTSPYRGCEFGLQLKATKKFHAYYKTNSGSNWTNLTPMPQTAGTVNSDNSICSEGTSGVTAVIKATFGNNKIIMQISISNGQKFEYSFSLNLADPSSIKYGIRKFMSLCPQDAETGTPPNLYNKYYFKNIKFSNAKIKKAGTVSNWNYNYSFNQYAAAYNTEFIDAAISGNSGTISISYKGRNSSNVLLF